MVSIRRLRLHSGRRSTVLGSRARISANTSRLKEIPTSRHAGVLDIEVRRTRENNSPYLANSTVERRSVIRGNNNYLEVFLNTDYRLGLSPFRIIKTLDIKSSIWNKILNAFYIIIAILNTLFYLKLKKIYIDLEDGNRIPLYVGWGFGLCLGLQRMMYWWNLLANQCSFQNLLETLQAFSVVSLTHNQRIPLLVRTLRITSALMSAIVAGFGLNLIPRSLVRERGWCFLDVFLAHEYEIQQAFPDITVLGYANEAQHLKNGTNLNQSNDFMLLNSTQMQDQADDGCNDWNKMTTYLGVVGIIHTFTGYMMDTCPQDLLLLSAILLYQAMNSLNIERYSKKGKDFEITPGEDLKKTFTSLLNQYNSIFEFSKSMNEIFEKMIPMIEMVGIGSLVELMSHSLEGNWNGAVVVAFGLVKLQATFYFAVKVTKKFKKFQSWFVSNKTQKILNLDDDQVEMIKQEFSINPIGIGSGPFYINMGFIANFYTVAFTYFFLIAEAVADNKKG